MSASFKRTRLRDISACQDLKLIYHTSQYNMIIWNWNVHFFIRMPNYILY